MVDRLNAGKDVAVEPAHLGRQMRPHAPSFLKKNDRTEDLYWRQSLNLKTLSVTILYVFLFRQAVSGTHLVVLVHGIVEIEANGMVVATVPGCPAPPCLGAHVGRLGRA